jgi:UDPglucose 6-dehydrogenase
MNICVVGTGYVGLVTGAVFADLGNEVICIDNQPEKVAELRAGRMPIYEPGLEEMVARNVADGRLTFSTDLGDGVRRSVIVFITVGTPPQSDGRTDLTAVGEVARAIGEAMDRYTVVVNKSTVPVGTGDFVREVIERHQKTPVPFDVVSNPEFLREGSAIEDTLRPDRIVIGAPTQQVAMSLLELYAPLAGADVTQVMKGMGLDARIGAAFLSAGLGYGGSCFPKDTDSLVATAAALGYEFAMLRAVVDVNRERAGHFVAMMDKALNPMEGRVVAVLGLAFKPNTDDMREAKSIEVISALLAAGAVVRAYDPVAMANARRMLPTGVEYRESPYDAATGADAVALVTEWNEFKFLNLERLRTVMRRPLVFDGRNLWEPERMRRLGFEYHSIGRKPVLPPS